jgi:hypothetical protein
MFSHFDPRVGPNQGFDKNRLYKCANDAEGFAAGIEDGRELHVPLFAVGLANEMLSTAKVMGHSQQDSAVLFDVAARMSGMSEA